MDRYCKRQVHVPFSNPPELKFVNRWPLINYYMLFCVFFSGFRSISDNRNAGIIPGVRKSGIVNHRRFFHRYFAWRSSLLRSKFWFFLRWFFIWLQKRVSVVWTGWYTVPKTPENRKLPIPKPFLRKIGANICIPFNIAGGVYFNCQESNQYSLKSKSHTLLTDNVNILE